MKQKGFTMIELLVVIVIIGILATVSVAAFNGSIDKSRGAKLMTEWTDDQKLQAADCIAAQDRDDCSYEVPINGQIWSGFDTNIGAMVDGDAAGLAEYGTEKVCIDEDEVNCDVHGGLYSYEAAITMCPEGWRLPLVADFNTLVAGSTSPSILRFETVNGACGQSSSCAANASDASYITSEPVVSGLFADTFTIVSGPDLNGGTVSTAPAGTDEARGLVRCIKE